MEEVACEWVDCVSIPQWHRYYLGKKNRNDAICFCKKKNKVTWRNIRYNSPIGNRTGAARHLLSMADGYTGGYNDAIPPVAKGNDNKISVSYSAILQFLNHPRQSGAI